MKTKFHQFFLPLKYLLRLKKFLHLLIWMCGIVTKDRIINEYIRDSLRVTPTENKMRGNRLRRFMWYAFASTC